MPTAPGWVASAMHDSQVLVIVAPGQGAQTPGFLTKWLELDSFASRFELLSQASGVDLVAHGTISDQETITDTSIAQPLLVASAIAVGRELLGDLLPDMLAGHSVGEIGAAALARVLDDTQAMALVAARGTRMAEAAALTRTGMSAVVAGDPPDVLSAIEATGCTAANNNGKGQIVAAGTLEQLEVLAANPPKRARVIPLKVAGAFHTVHMAPAIPHLETVAASMTTAAPHTLLVSNRDGQIVNDGAEYLARLISQITSPVRWDQCMATMAAAGVSGILELAPAGTLTGIAKRNLPGVELFNLNTPDQLGDARAFVTTHSSRESK